MTRLSAQERARRRFLGVGLLVIALPVLLVAALQPPSDQNDVAATYTEVDDPTAPAAETTTSIPGDPRLRPIIESFCAGAANSSETVYALPPLYAASSTLDGREPLGTYSIPCGAVRLLGRLRPDMCTGSRGQIECDGGWVLITGFEESTRQGWLNPGGVSLPLSHLPIIAPEPIAKDGRPDLTFDLSAGPQAGDRCSRVGGNPTPPAVMMNQGSAVTPASIVVEYYGKRNTVTLHRGLEPGETFTVDYFFHGVRSVTGGTVVLDPDGMIEEVRESNNTFILRDSNLICVAG